MQKESLTPMEVTYSCEVAVSDDGKDLQISISCSHPINAEMATDILDGVISDNFDWYGLQTAPGQH